MAETSDRDVRAYAFNAAEILRRDPVNGIIAVLDVWDPIRVSNEVPNEYASYAPHLASLAARGATVPELAEELARIQTGMMGVVPRAENDLRCARALAALLAGSP